MKAVVVWSEPALDDLCTVLAYLKERSPAAAARLQDEVESQTPRLERFPLSGRKVPEFPDWKPELRELIVLDYRLVYAVVSPKRLEILAFFHGRRLFQKDDLADLRASRKAWDTHSGVAETAIHAKEYFSKRAKKRGPNE